MVISQSLVHGVLEQIDRFFLKFLGKFPSALLHKTPPQELKFTLKKVSIKTVPPQDRSDSKCDPHPFSI